MRGVHSEYVLKGIFIGLLFYVALQSPGWAGLGRVALFMLGGLVLALVLGVIDQWRRRQRFGGGPAALLLFLLLEYPMLVYAGVILGLFAGAVAERDPDLPKAVLTYCALGGGILGYALAELRQVKDNYYRLAATLLAAAAGVGGGYWWLQQQPFFAELDRTMLGVQILLGLPFFYLLTFSGRSEESEVEIALICAAMGVGIWLVQFPKNLPAAGFLIPVTLYYVYATRVLPGLRVFKHVLRGYSYLSMGRVRDALRSFRRALELDAKSQLAREGLWKLHRTIELAQIEHDPETLNLLDFQMCLDRAGALLSGGRVPSPDQRDEARRLLDLVERQRPEWKAEVSYYRALLDAHEKRIDEAAARLSELLDPSAWPEGDASRRRILLNAWQLAMVWHPGLRRRVGEVQIEQPGRRMEAIAAVERHLAKNPDDESVAELRLMLYTSLREDEYFAAAGAKTPRYFNHDYAEQLGLAQIHDPERWRRGAEYLRMAGRGLPRRGPTIFTKLADAYERAGEMDMVRRYLEQVLRSGLEAGVEALEDEEQKKTFFASVKRLADDAAARGDLDAAIANYNVFAQSPQSGIETYRTLADLYERKGDSLAALRATETGLTYSSKDKDLLERKDRYYYSVAPEQLRQARGEVRPFFDVEYCKRKAKQILDARQADADALDWAWHLAQLARVMDPKNLAVQALVARCLLRRGERDAAVQILEDIRESKPSGGEAEEAWYWACQQLGRLYLDELNRPDLAKDALLDFKRSHKSGADTIYHLGRAYEALGDHAHAMQCYEQVTAYERHPLYYEARDALERLKAQKA